jgi:4-amino-4-deoxy-L-arabinose transferase-like glycosyltransferase
VSIEPRRFVFITILIFAGIALLQSATRPVVDWDEIVYLHLSTRMTWLGGNYTTAGSPIAERLPQPVYRSPVFHHPPLIPFLIKLFSTFLPPLGAARLVTALFHALLLWSIFAVADKLSGVLAGMIALALACLCPILNLEARLVHLDLPMTAFVLLGTKWLLDAAGPPKLAASGAAFAASFLCKFTGPLLLPIPLILFLWSEHRRSLRHLLAFFGTLALGFLWWGYIAFRFGTLMPDAFHMAGLVPFTPYLRELARRKWYDLFLYFVALCPVAVIYAARLDILRRERGLALLNAGAWVSAVGVGVALGTQNPYWVFRFFLPLVAIIYISVGCILTRMLEREAPVWNSYLIVLMLFTAFVMTWSTATSVDRGGLEPIPVALFWLGLGQLFR